MFSSCFVRICHRKYLVSSFIKMPYYAVARGRNAGIYHSWAECEAQVKGFPGAKYKKFNSTDEASSFITNNSSAASVKNFSSSSVKRKAPVPVNVTSSDTDEDFENMDDMNGAFVKHVEDIEKRINNIKNTFENIPNYGQSKRLRTQLNKNSFQMDKNGFVHVYTDGACSSNGRNGAKAGLGVYFGEGHPLNASKPVKGRATNNCGEIQAATEAIRTAHANGVNKLCINTDSKFVINAMTKWIKGWKRNNWTLKSGEPVKNRVDFEELDKARKQVDVKFNYVEAHKGILGNERADQLAKDGAAIYKQR